jgi:hypothetical protein
MKKDFYTKKQIFYQNKFNSCGLAKRLEELSVRNSLNDFAIDFISSISMMFISSVNTYGYPTVSYKGGNKGFIKINNRNKITFPNYDGNGMFLTLGNITETKKIGILFISFEKPFRLRLEGTARVIVLKKKNKKYIGANSIIEVNIERVWENCPRYIHRAENLIISKSVPSDNNVNPHAEWKRIDLLQDVLPYKTVKINKKVGTITANEWKNKVINGDPSAE